MADSHSSLRDDFQVSCAELDIMIAIASQQIGFYGARMTGGGFGGCTINLVNVADAEHFKRCVAAEFLAATGIEPSVYIYMAAQGASALDDH